MAAVRLDPFRRIVGVGWPSAVGPFRVLYQFIVGSGATIGVNLHGNQTGLYVASDAIRLTLADFTVYGPLTPLGVFYSPLTTFPAGFGHPAIATPAGFTAVSYDGTLGVSPSADAAPVLIEILRGGVILSQSLATWSQTASYAGGWPLVGGSMTRVAVK